MKKLLSMGPVLLVLVVIISGCAAEASPVIEAVSKVPIKLASMKIDVVEKTYISVGEVVPGNQVDLFINGGGFIESIEVKSGDTVEEDQVLLLLDNNDVDRTNYNATESQLRTVRDNLGGQLASLTEEQARKQVLYEEGLITINELNQAQLQIDGLSRDYSNAKTAYYNQLKILENNLEDSVDSRIFESPISGTVASVFVQEGQSVNGQLALTIVDDRQLYVQTFISSDLKKELSIGDKVRLNLHGEDEAHHIGTIQEMKGLPDSNTKLFEVKIAIDIKDSYIIGDYAEIEFIIERYEAVMVPTQSIVRSGESQFIYVYEDEQVTKTLLETGATNGEWVEAKNTDNLDQVVVLGQNQLTTSSEIMVVD